MEMASTSGSLHLGQDPLPSHVKSLQMAVHDFKNKPKKNEVNSDFESSNVAILSEIMYVHETNRS